LFDLQSDPNEMRNLAAGGIEAGWEVTAETMAGA
jgi:hypothetical protein